MAAQSAAGSTTYPRNQTRTQVGHQPQLLENGGASYAQRCQHLALLHTCEEQGPHHGHSMH